MCNVYKQHDLAINMSLSLLLNVVAAIVKRHSRRRRKTASEGGDDDGVEYPLDIWYLISEYIRPEDVSTFARICKSALHVVSTAKFWFRLYRRYKYNFTQYWFIKVLNISLIQHDGASYRVRTISLPIRIPKGSHSFFCAMKATQLSL